MSMEICVLSDSRLRSVSEWQQAIDAEGFSLRLPDKEPLADAIGGNLVAQLNAVPTAIEYSLIDLSELKETCRTGSFGHDWKYVVAFIWSSDFAEEIAAWMAATAYARATNGVIFDEEKGQLFTPDESVQITREVERRRPELEEALRDYLEQR